ncbi:hypothetical protein BJD99_01295 [Rhodococcus sp. 1163]|nr:hypothetical protein BJD99_01295 [Rhodococcus sp. 1163]
MIEQVGIDDNLRKARDDLRFMSPVGNGPPTAENAGMSEREYDSAHESSCLPDEYASRTARTTASDGG